MITTGNPRFEKNLHSSGKIPGKIRSLRHFPPADPVRGRLCAGSGFHTEERCPGCPRGTPPARMPCPLKTGRACGTGFPGNASNRTEFRAQRIRPPLRCLNHTEPRALRLNFPRGCPARTKPRALRLSSPRGCPDHTEPRALRLNSPRGGLNHIEPGRASAPAGPSLCSNPPGCR